MIKIPLSHTEKGMIIVETDKKWLKLPFFNKPLTDTNNIELLKNYGVKFVFISDTETTEEEDKITKEQAIEFIKSLPKEYRNVDNHYLCPYEDAKIKVIDLIKRLK